MANEVTASSTLGGPSTQVIATSNVGADKAMIRAENTGAVIPFIARSVRIRQQMGVCDSLRFRVMLGPGETNRLKVGDPISIYNDEREEKKVWGGTIDAVSEEDQIGAEDYTREVEYTGVCYTSIADRFFVAKEYTDMTVGDIVRDLVDTHLADDNVTKTGIQDGPTIQVAQFSYITVAEALNELSDETGFYWFIDQDREMIFKPRTAVVAPFEITDTNRPFISLTVERNRDEYRNVQIIRAGEDLTTERTETFVGDGTRQTFNTSFPMGVEPTVQVNGSAQTVGIRGVESGQDWFWNKGRTELSQNDQDTALTASDTLTVTYQGLVPIVVQNEDPEAIQERQDIEGGSGRYENLETAPQVDDKNQALSQSEGLLDRFAQIEETLGIETDDTRLRKGQLLSVELTNHGIDADYLISQLRWRIRDDNQFRVDLEAKSGDSVGGWTRYFRSLQRAQRDFVIRDNENLLVARRLVEKLDALDAATLSQSSPPYTIGNFDIGFAEVT